ncbi:hypothetical protein [Limosilactobacillus kribbianus]|uniref:hypothetical protein n=1 Tax=Limosilactobacillus kribbianus TaxID=2982695 RepID=UPI0022650AC8|nr:hypothetical protein [Limosilactobacillus kribbianus]
MAEPEKHTDDQTLVEEHAFKRLDNVEKERRKVYKKRPEGPKFFQFIMVIVLLIVLVVMLLPMIYQG